MRIVRLKEKVLRGKIPHEIQQKEIFDGMGFVCIDNVKRRCYATSVACSNSFFHNSAQHKAQSVSANESMSVVSRTQALSRVLVRSKSQSL